MGSGGTVMESQYDLIAHAVHQAVYIRQPDNIQITTIYSRAQNIDYAQVANYDPSSKPYGM